ncbi:MAG: septum formation family protein [Ilumatobacteraceae bacterium]
MNATSKLLLIAATLGSLGLSACSGSTASADRNDDGTIVSDGTVDAFSVHVGDCYNDDRSLVDSAGSAEVSSVGAVPCDAPHDNEIFALVVASSSSGAFPGDELIFSDNVGACEAGFARYVGIEYSESFLGMGPLLVPSAQTWATGDREVVCGVFTIDGAKLTGSVKGAGDSVRAAAGSTAESTVRPSTTSSGAEPGSEPGSDPSADVAAFCARVDELADQYALLLNDPASGDVTALVAQSQVLTASATAVLTAHPDQAAAVSACLDKLTAAVG